MKFIGYTIATVGLISFIYTAVNYVNNSETFGLLGMDIAITKGDPMPMLISLCIIIIGVVIARFANVN